MRSGGGRGTDRSTGSLAENQREPERRLGGGKLRFQGSGRRMLGSFFTLSPTPADVAGAYNILRVAFWFSISVIAYGCTMSAWLYIAVAAGGVMPAKYADRISADLKKQRKS